MNIDKPKLSNDILSIIVTSAYSHWVGMLGITPDTYDRNGYVAKAIVEYHNNPKFHAMANSLASQVTAAVLQNLEDNHV